MVASRRLRRDEAQLSALRALDAVRVSLLLPERPDSQRAAGLESTKGAYLYGEVGSGKTMLMDMLYEHAPEPKLRVHFEDFMRQVYARLWQVRADQEDYEFATTGKPGSGRPAADALVAVADELAARYKLVCFDEFQMPDMASATILSRLFRLLIEHGLVLVFTSNLSPLELCGRGLHHKQAAPLLRLIQERFQVVSVNAGTDYRLQLPSSSRFRTFFTPLTPEAATEMQQLAETIPGHAMRHVPIDVDHVRTLTMPWSRAVAMMSFSDICSDFVGPDDYAAIARMYGIVFITDVPQLTSRYAQQARRFITLIDYLYNNKIKLVMSAAVPIDEIFRLDTASSADEFDQSLDAAEDVLNKQSEYNRGKNSSAAAWWHEAQPGLSLAAVYQTGVAEQFAAARAVSRLHEMQSERYWHTPRPASLVL